VIASGSDVVYIKCRRSAHSSPCSPCSSQTGKTLISAVAVLYDGSLMSSNKKAFLVSHSGEPRLNFTGKVRSKFRLFNGSHPAGMLALSHVDVAVADDQH
jgi:hypothetical protein